MQNIIPIPKTAPQLPTTCKIKIGDKYFEEKYGFIWTYKDHNGSPLFYTVRIDSEIDGKKIKNILPLSLWKNENSMVLKWEFKRPDMLKFPLYNQQFIHSYPEASIVVVEGEKCAELAQQLFFAAGQYKIIFVSTFAGSNNVQFANISSLSKRKVFLFPDNDDVGYKAMEYIGNNIVDAESITFIHTPRDLPKGYDIADFILQDNWDCKKIFNFIKTNSKPFIQSKIIPANPKPAAQIIKEPNKKDIQESLAPFRPLGVLEGKIWFLLKETHETISIPERRICHKDDLITLAPINYWEKNYVGKTSPNYEAAGDQILRIARRLGIFDITQIRGRGVWYEGKDIVINAGNKLIINGQPQTIFSHKSEYIYSVRPKINIPNSTPLNNNESKAYLDLCNMLCWAKPQYGLYQAGWTVLATVCGAWSWRPNLWITAEHGAGKSYNISNIIAPILGKWGIGLVGNVTEAGIRQLLNSDSLSIYFDESEGESLRGQERLQNILEMIRHSASEGQMKMVKGSPDGQAKLYDIRSMFLLSSIGVNLTKGADISRITLLHLLKNKSNNARSHFETLDSTALKLLTPEYCEQMRERIRRLIPKIKESYEVFRKIIAEKTGSQRTGDQAGMLLSGAFALVSHEAATQEIAINWANKIDWGVTSDFTVDKDSEVCLNHILEYQVSCGGQIHSIGELIYKAYIDKDELQDVLGTYGIRVKDGYVCFCCKHSILGKKVLAGTAWVNCYDMILERTEGAERTRLSFSGYKRNSICIPIKQIIE